jgi:putative spermidine/putrescine transport system permease protein
MTITPLARIVLRIATGLTLVFIWTPLAIVALYAFNDSRIQAWPLDGFTTEWFRKALDNPGARDAFLYSLKVALGATLLALALGTLLSLAVARHRFVGRETLSFLVILPIALPGIVTGMALNATFKTLGVQLGLLTLIVAHATFCIVVVYNNVIARLRRLGGSLEEASADLGAHTWQTFRHITLPNMQTALVAGALLAFALSFDEIIVTTFTLGAGDQTLPIWIFSNLFRGQQLPITNVVAVIVVLISIIPVYLAHRLTREESIAGRGASAVAEGTAIP